MVENKSFDEITLEYAMKRNILEKIDERFDTFCVYFLKEIDSKIQRTCKEFSNEHNGCLFEHDDSGHENLESKVTLRYRGKPYVDFVYGFDWNIKVKNDNEVFPSKEGCDFFIYVELLPKILGNKNKLKKYYKQLEKYYTGEGLTAHENDDDTDIYFYWDIISVDKKFSLKKIIKEVEEAFDSLFKDKQDLECFIKKIPQQKI